MISIVIVKTKCVITITMEITITDRRCSEFTKTIANQRRGLDFAACANTVIVFLLVIVFL